VLHDCALETPVLSSILLAVTAFKACLVDSHKDPNNAVYMFETLTATRWPFIDVQAHPSCDTPPQPLHAPPPPHLLQQNCIQPRPTVTVCIIINE
jgi:hypothetical protein